MKECLYCKKSFTPKRDTAKFCSASCRVMNHRKHGFQNEVTKVQMQALYNLMMDKLGSIDLQPKSSPYIATIQPTPYNQPLSYGVPQMALKTFEQYKAQKIDTESFEDWEKLKAEIEAAPNLSSKQKELLIKYA